MRLRTTISVSLVLAIVSAASWAKQGHAAHHHPIPSVKDRHARVATGGVPRKRRQAPAGHAERRRGEHLGHHPLVRRDGRSRHRHRRLAGLPPQDRYIGSLHVVGPSEVGKAAWYGRRFLGDRTASGDRLDAIHATAAHRSLPLHSLVRIINLRNGRTAIAEINDRGPVSRKLLIDLSPRTARELHMIESGIAPVVVVPVAAAKRPAR
jgi:rare lipoprotein A